MRGALALGLWLGCVVSLANGQNPNLVLRDGDFSPNSWVSRKLSGNGSFTATTENAGGNPGAYRHTLHVTQDAVLVSHRSTAANLSYSPQLQGAVRALTYAYDVKVIHGTAGLGQRLLVYQNGATYASPRVDRTDALTSWTTITGVDVLASTSFSKIDGTGPDHPDFSSSGADIFFGYLTSNPVPQVCDMYGTCTPSPQPVTFDLGLDNLTINIFSSSVPPATTAGNQPNTGTATDPISTATGEYYEQTPEISLGGPLALRFARYYASYLKSSGVTSLLGNNWMHNFDVALRLAGTGALAVLFHGKQVRFSQTQTGWQLENPQQYPYELVASAAGYRLMDPSENLIYDFDSNGKLSKIEDRNGNALTLSQSASSPGPDQVSDGLGRTLTFSYSGNKLSKVQDQSGRALSFSYTGDDLTAAMDPNGKTTRYTYSQTGGLAGLMTAKTLPAGDMRFTNALDGQGRIVRQTDGAGNSTDIAFDRPAPGITTVTNPLALSFQHTYQAGGNLANYVDASGQMSAVAYDAGNRLTSLLDRMGDKSTITYDAASGRAASFTDAQGATIKYSYVQQAQGPFTFYNLSRIDYADGTSTAFTYDSSGNRTSTTDQAGKKTTYSYNSRGQPSSWTNAAGGVTTLSYNSDGTLATQTTPAGDQTTYSYDDKKRLVKVVNPDGSAASYSYDGRGRLLAATDELGKTRTLAYDDNGRLQSLSDASGRALTAQYGPNQLPASLTNSGSQAAGFAFDAAGRLKTVTAPTGEAVQFGFDSLNRLASVSDCSGKGIGFSYDKEGVISALRDGAGSTWSVSTDKTGRIVQFVSPLARNFGFSYDKLGRLLAVTDPLGGAAVYTRDARGLLSSVSLPGGLSAAYQRNELGRVTIITDPNGNISKLSYDPQGRRISATDPNGQVTNYTYDSRGRAAMITLPQGSVGLTYDAAGNLIRRLYSDGLDLNFNFNENNLVTAANGVTLDYNLRGDVTASNGIAISRDASFRISAITYAPGLAVQYAYDCRGLLVQVTDWMGGATQLAYDDARRLISITRPNGVVTQYTYDLDSRLVGINESSAAVLSNISLTRDGGGRITSADRSVPLLPKPAAGVMQFAYDAAAQAVGGAYDGLGRPAALGIHNYTWDLASRLTSFSGPDGAAAFTYDAYGQRISRTGGDGTTLNYALNYALPVPAVNILRDGSGNDLRYYVWLPDGTLLYSIQASDANRSFFHFDEMGSTLFLTDDSGAITDSYGITPYGEQVDHNGPSDNPFTYLGAQGVMQEGATGLFYMGFRYYDSSAGRFLSRDPAPGIDPRALNPYQYAFGNPLLFSDPLGQGPRAGRKGNRAEGQFGQFILGLPYLPHGLRNRNESIAPRLAGAILEFLHGRERRKETDSP